MASSYVPLQLQSNYSLLTGTASLEHICQAAGRHAFPALALTDLHNLYAAIPFYKLARETGFKPIIGVELVHRSGRAILFARNLDGYANLCRLVSRRNLDDYFQLDQALTDSAKGLVIITQDLALAESLADRIDRHFLWLALTRHTASPKHEEPTRHAARKLELGLVALNRACFLEPDDFDLHCVLVAIRENALLARLKPTDTAHPQSFLASPERMHTLYRDAPEALEATLEIAESCELTIPMGRPIFPKCALPPGDTPAAFLLRKCREGLTRRYASPPRPVLERLDRELTLIDKLGFSEYFIIVGGIVDYAHGIGVPTVGRGSGAGSIVSYLLGITNVDPIAFKLPFERFLNLERADCPDLDIDLCWKLRDQVIDYVYRTYGAEHVAMIATHNMFGPQSAFREVAKAFGIPNALVNRISKRIPYHDSVEAAADIPNLTLEPDTLNTVIDLASKIEGFPHNLGIHCGGIVISDKPIDHYVPLQRAAKGIVITQYEMNAVEDIGLVKIDLLGNRALSTIRETVAILHNQSHLRVSPDRFPDADPDTIRLIASGRTLGCPQLESPAMRHLLAMLKPTGLRQVIQALALIRPAPASIGMKETFIRRARGLEPTRFEHPSLKNVLGDTFGIMLYEDDAMLVAATLAGLSLEAGDQLRKALKKSRTHQQILELSRYFLKRALQNGIPPQVAKDVWAQMAKFSDYSFCRAHAAGYGVAAYQSAYLKTHFPLQYMTAALNNVQGIYPRRVHVWEARRMGLNVLPPCVNASAVECACEADHIRMGLAQVKGLTTQTMDRILHERERARFDSLDDFMHRVNLSLAELESLILVGAFDFTALIRPELVLRARTLFAKRKTPSKGRVLFRRSDALSHAPGLTDFSLRQKLDYELDILDCPLSAHPAELARRNTPRNGLIRSDALSQFIGRHVSLIGILDAARGTNTVNGKLMQFITLEDETGLFEITLFPETYRRSRRLLSDLGPYRVHGVPQLRYDSLSVTAHHLDRP